MHNEPTNEAPAIDPKLVISRPPLSPQEREEKEKAEEAARIGMPAEQIDFLAQLAMAPKKGEQFTLAGRSFRMAFVSITIEQEMIAQMVNILRDSGEQDMATALVQSLPELVELCGLILSSKIYMGKSQEECVQWIREQEGEFGITSSQLLSFVMGQAALQEVAQALGKLLMPAGLAGMLSRAAAGPQVSPGRTS